MVAPVAVSEKDLQTLLEVAGGHRSDLPEAGLAPSLLADLMGQIRCDVMNFNGQDSRRKEFWFGQEIPASAEDDEGSEQAFWEQYRACEICSYPDRSGDLRSVTMLSDFYSVRQWHSTGMYADVFRPLGLEHLLLLCLPAGTGPGADPSRTARLILYRGSGPDFSQRDRALLALLRPHLHQAYLDAERRRSGTPQLTPRQRELLRLVAAGHTNVQIARQLGVSEGTVRIHLQNIYGRLQVQSRTAAVTRAFPDPAAM